MSPAPPPPPSRRRAKSPATAEGSRSARRPAQRPPRTPRRAALVLLVAVLDRHRPLDDVFDGAVDGLAPRDRAFTRLLVSTTLRHLGHLDALLAECLERPLPAEASRIHHLLRLGATQLVCLQTPPHAAVGESVALARTLPTGARFAGLVNAVLRRVAREGADRLATLRADSPGGALPPWLMDSWRQAYGADLAEAIARSIAREAPLDLTPRLAVGEPPSAESAQAVADQVGGTLLPTGSVRLPAGTPVPTLPGYDAGAWWIQDAAAALPVRLAASARPEGLAGLRVVDLCAAPGGKTLQLAASGASVLAVDRSSERLERLRENLARTGLGPAVVCHAADAATDPAAWGLPSAEHGSPGSADLVLVDAPCSATGTIRRHPDVAWVKRPQDVESLTRIQDALLDTAWRLVRPGGLIVYCVCSLQPEEGAPRVDAALARHEDVARLPIDPCGRDAVLGLEPAMITVAGDLRLLPCHWEDRGGLDGFFVARLIKAETPSEAPSEAPSGA